MSTNLRTNLFVPADNARAPGYTLTTFDLLRRSHSEHEGMQTPSRRVAPSC